MTLDLLAHSHSEMAIEVVVIIGAEFDSALSSSASLGSDRISLECNFADALPFPPLGPQNKV